ncbi:hypothetical protein CLM62_32210 [Streptomyces sp. SA15]|uniref:peptidoglycan-binding domain-containing protein n=1 Tax=Streptomyces sp. SA15 TaxID=934019 RepID=UPI000BAFCBDD|nr:peptidoglycan-binding domain-containing protein [Streptomyces sp. SA15]PAZ12023.1 hypothetical protein CLM62_32210 [Streptomyces sp. SA15]
MRAITRTLIGVTTAVGIAAGSLAAAGTAFAAPAQDTRAVASAEAVAPLEENNLGLDAEQAKNWQCWVRDRGYNPGEIDGRLGTQSWKAAQQMLNDKGHNAGNVDGDVGPNTISALQRYLNTFGYGLAVDGVDSEPFREAFRDFNNTGC